MVLIGLDRMDTTSGLFVMITMTTTQNNIVSHTDVDDDDGKSPTQSLSQDEDAQYWTVMVMVAKEQVCGIMNINKAMAIKSSCNVRGLGHSTFFHNQQDSLSPLSFMYTEQKRCRFQIVKVHLESRLSKRNVTFRDWALHILP